MKIASKPNLSVNSWLPSYAPNVLASRVVRIALMTLLLIGCLFCYLKFFNKDQKESSGTLVAQVGGPQPIDAGLAINSKPLAIFVIGGPGTGKNTWVEKFSFLNAGALTIDTDLVKEGMKEYQEGIKNGDKGIAAKVHQQSIFLRDNVFTKAMKGKKSFFFVGTGSDCDYYKRILNSSKSKGYNVWLVLVKTDLEKAKERAKKRGEETGRVVPQNCFDNFEEIHENYQRLKLLADGCYIYNNDSDCFQLEESLRRVE